MLLIGRSSVSSTGVPLDPRGRISCSRIWPQNEEGEDDETEIAEIILPNDLSLPWLGHAFPFATVTKARLEVRQLLFTSLPERETARRMAEVYYRHCAWMCVWFRRPVEIAGVNYI